MRYLRSRLLSSLVVLACVAALGGCTRIQVKLAWKIHLEKVPVSSIAVSLPGARGIAPGEKSPLVVTLTQPDGRVLYSEGKGGGKVMWSDLAVTSTVATSKKGAVSLPADPRVSDGRIPHVIVTVPSHPDLRAELDIPVRYDRKYAAHFSGMDGISGTDGTSGISGTDGIPGSIDLNNPSPGGDGTDGSNGGDGSDGSDGGNAPDVKVLVAFRPGVHPLLQISVSAEGNEEFYLVDPYGGSLTATSEGGRGGSGGSGGSGGRGGSGGIGTPNGRSGRDGNRGHDGSSGHDGSDGAITVTYDPQAKPFLSALHFGNRPRFVERQVPPLW